MKQKKRMLVLCTGNSCRSQMAQGFLQEFGGENWEIFSAGIETHGLNKRAVRVMQETGVDISHHTSDHIDQYRDMEFDYVLTVCDHAQESCPLFPSSAEKIHHSFRDPANATGSEEEVLNGFRRIRDEIQKFAQQFIDRHSD